MDANKNTRSEYVSPAGRLISLETAKETVQTGFSTIDWEHDPEELG